MSTNYPDTSDDKEVAKNQRNPLPEFSVETPKGSLKVKGTAAIVALVVIFLAVLLAYHVDKNQESPGDRFEVGNSEEQ